MRGKGSEERRIKLLKTSRLLHRSPNGTGLPLEDRTQMTTEKLPGLYIISKNNLPYEGDNIKNEHKSHESLKKNSDIQYFHLFNIARSDAIPCFCQQPE